jgi:hypothetical protein
MGASCREQRELIVFCRQVALTHDGIYAGMNQISEKQLNEAEKQFKQFEALINSMTPEERSNPDLLAKVCTPPPTSCAKAQSNMNVWALARA